MAEYENVAKVDDMKSGDRLSVIVDDTPVLLIRVEDSFYAIEDVCTHDGQPLTDGILEGDTIACARHGAKFDLKTGEAVCMPATEGVPLFDVKIEDGSILVAPNEGTAITVATVAKSEPAPPLVNFNSASAAAPKSDSGNESAASSETAVLEGPMPEDVELIDALKQVIDPELMINIVDLGLIYNIEKEEDSKVAVDLTLTSPACPAGPQIMQQAKMALERLRGVASAEIKLVMTPPWTPERMTDDARDQLGIF